MLDRALSTYFTSRSPTPVYMGKLNMYIDTLTTKREEVIKRSILSHGTETKGMVLLRHVLAIVDVSNMRRYDSDIDRYLNCVLPVVDDMERLFDTTTTGIIRTNLFIHNSSKCTEILVPVTTSDVLSDFPIDRSWGAWSRVRAIRLLDLDSDELTFNIYKDQIHFKNDHPSLAIFSVDVTALCLQYAKFLDLDDSNKDIPIQEYLHTHVLTEGFALDLQNIWMKNKYLKIMKTATQEAGFNRSDIMDSITHNIYGYIGSQYTSAMEEYSKLLSRVYNKNMPPSRLLESIPFVDMNLSKYVQTINKATNIDSGRQTRWIEFLKDWPWIELVYIANQLNPDHTESISLMRNLNRDLDILRKSRFWTSILNSKIKDIIEDKFEQLERFH